MTRRAGILLHPTSFPGREGIGTLGSDAYRVLDWFADAGISTWQILPLGPTGYGDSPYQAFSAFAGNPYLLSLFELAGQGWLSSVEAAQAPHLSGLRVDYGAVIPAKLEALTKAEDAFWRHGTREHHDPVLAFREREGAWLEDYALFMALKEAHGGASWDAWPAPLRDRDPAALRKARDTHHAAIRRHVTWQAWFDQQWRDVRAYAHALDIEILGDVPVFVAFDASDVWVNRELFDLQPNGRPRNVAGVPPDYFSETGQRWGNPLYRWDVMADRGYAWWTSRLQATLRQVDVIRIDHFRGFAAYWEIPAGEPTAVKGRWRDGPGQAFFDALENKLGPLPIVAEDLGVITPDVEALRDANGLPGMKVLQFAFAGDAQDPYLPHNYPARSVVYTGTHDNDTSVGWFQKAPKNERDHVLRYLASSGERVVLDLIRAAFASVAERAVIPLQDVLELDSRARMNLPGQAAGNWGWRASWEHLTSDRAAYLRSLAELYGRARETGATDTPYRQSSL